MSRGKSLPGARCGGEPNRFEWLNGSQACYLVHQRATLPSLRTAIIRRRAARSEESFRWPTSEVYCGNCNSMLVKRICKSAVFRNPS
ncbi:hypothetical protein BZM27_00155 [Paraburkholderia steynii]|uniref:Uncharacterized protein n=1 Tax=Paraburkholderia steynii TaxID=1245441 RepID=A0A4R0XR50_9BURK|nr:hypothetical protein BZM27_00155 [Paraburkholderia steynii]